MAEVILDWFDEGLNVDTFHLVGHSLGGQMCGVIGRSVYKKTRRETQVLRISALDPAFPGFYPSLGTPAVNKNDARFVDIIHTDAWLYGIPIATGHADFWPNSGKSLQPGCPRRGMLLTLSDVGKVMFLLYFNDTMNFGYRKRRPFSGRKNKLCDIDLVRNVDVCFRFGESSSIMVVLGR